jgi:hypothetical protein
MPLLVASTDIDIEDVSRGSVVEVELSMSMIE